MDIEKMNEEEAKKAKKEAIKAAKAKEILATSKQQAGNMISTYDIDNVIVLELGQLQHWDKNPRHEYKYSSDIVLRASLIDEDGNLTYDVRYPFVVRKADNGKFNIIQGNRRYKIMKGAGLPEDTLIQCVEHTGTDADALLIACSDTGTGIKEKGVGDLEQAIGSLFRDYGYSAYTVIAYLWAHRRELLNKLSPATKTCTTLEEAQSKRGRFQTLEKIARLPENIRGQVYAEHNAEIRKGKIFTTSLINQLCKARVEDMEAIIDGAKIVDDEETVIKKLTAKMLVDRRHLFKSSVLRQIAALFDTSDDDSRDVVKELEVIDVCYADNK